MFFPANHLTGGKKPVFQTSCLAGTSKPNLTATSYYTKT